jgi:two-component system cell cycle response regulator
MNNKIKILLIEDNPSDARLIREMIKDIEEPRFEIEWVSRLSPGIEQLAHGHFDALLLDLTLPDSEGIDTVEKVLFHTPDVPVIVLTGLADETTGMEAVHKGAQDYLVKGSVSSDLLIRSIRYSIERKRLMMDLLNLSLRDELTGLNNRRGFFALAEQLIKLSQRERKALLFVIADLDGLKKINDSLGHEKGDLALKDIATVMKETFRASDVIGRIGGDEFAVCLVEDEQSTAETVISRLEDKISAYNSEVGRPYQLSLSVGVSRFDNESPCSIDQMLTLADKEMYKQKRSKLAQE